MSLSERWGIDLGNVPMRIARPGDDLFNRYETIFTLMMRVGGMRKAEKRVREILGKGRRFKTSEVTVEDLVMIRRDEKIELRGELPGLSLMDDDPWRVMFFSVKEENVLEIVAREMENAGKKMSFDSIPEAVEYLRGLAKDLFFHEAGHVVYGQWGKFDERKRRWFEFMMSQVGMMDKVREIQREKYPDGKVPRGTVIEEGFVEYFQGVVTNGEVKSRLGENKAATDLVESLIEIESDS